MGHPGTIVRCHRGALWAELELRAPHERRRGTRGTVRALRGGGAAGRKPQHHCALDRRPMKQQAKYRFPVVLIRGLRLGPCTPTARGISIASPGTG